MRSILLFAVLAAPGLVRGGDSPLAASDNLIDRHVWAKLQADGVPHAPLASDGEFLRRAYLDLTGRAPNPEQVRAFEADERAEKRDRLIESLIPPIPKVGLRNDYKWPFLDRWTYFFSDMFKNGQLLEEGINVFREYIYKSLVLNTPYDEFVREMITASTVSTWTTGSANMIARWHVFEGDGYMINHEDTCDEIAINTAKPFLGINLECVSCHDGKGHLEKVNLWLAERKRDEFWRQAAFFGNTTISPAFGRSPEFIVRDTADGYSVETASSLRPRRYKADTAPAFILGGGEALPGESPRATYARVLTSHRQFARATVNLFWAELMGEGIVDPPMDFDLARQDPKNPPPAPWTLQPSHPELLEELAQEFENSGYDLRWLFTTITKSKTYQLSMEFDGEWLPRYERHFARRKARRLSAQQLFDGIADLTGVYREIPVRYDYRKVTTIMETRSPMDLDRNAGNKDLHEAASEFGMCDRYTREATREIGMGQAAILLNDEVVRGWIKIGEKGRLAELLRSKDPAPDDKIVEELFLAAVARRPSEDERAAALAHLAADRESGAEDLVWAVTNSLEFLFY